MIDALRKRGLVLVLFFAACSATAQDAPCQGEIYRAFDFWRGAWTVADAAGNPLGTNTISVGEAGCVLQESWRSAAGNTGRSLNFYDPVRDVWRQVWVSAGSIIDIEGGLDGGGSMVLTGSITYTGNATRQDFRGRWTLLPDGRVRQFFEQSAGSEWQPWFEGFYTRVTE